jgi:hypothetical protein
MPAERAKQRRTTQACDFCHSRGTRCRLDESGVDGGIRSCTTCVEYGEDCLWTRAPKKRGTKPGATGQAKSWKQRVIRDRSSISALLNVYLDTVHPVFPLYCERELWVGWRESTLPATPSQYISLICMCALSAQHVEQGSLFENQTPLIDNGTSAGSLLAEATDLLQVNQHEILDLEYVRSCGFLALLGLQTGDYNLLHKHLATYHGICAQFSLHDESQWGISSELTTCELEIRRRLYWAMYRLEVQSACVLGHMIRSPEVQSNVDYPIGLHHPAFVHGRDGDFEDWFAGWNTTTDLYRVLEHTIIDFRGRRRRHGDKGPRNYLEDDATIHRRLANIQQQALPQFREVHEKSTDSGKNRCSFQATNILFTIHLIRMFTTEPTPQSMQAAAEALLESVKRIPPEYIRANGRRLLEELAGTALMLGTVAARVSTSEEEVRSLLALQEALASFIESSTSANSIAPALAVRLRRQMAERSQHSARANCPVIHNTGLTTTSSSGAQDDQWWELLDINDLMSETGIFNSRFRPGLIVDPRWPD